ncbi:MAG: acetate--CoA ligase family protein [Quisquiliibacterium sp.]
MSGDWIRALLDPRAVALVGASGDIRKNTARPQRFLTACGWQGRILPINPARPEILGLPAYKSLLDAPGEIDQAFIMLGADDVEGVIEQCAQRAVPVATIFSDGFAEIGGDGVAKQARLVDTAHRLGVRLLGPNCIGLIRSDNGLALTVNAVLDTDRPRPGSLGLISQSGSMLGSIMSRGLARGLAFSTMVSVGNEADIGVAELIEVLVDDPKTETILLFLETLRDAPAFARAVGRARAAGKPVAAYLLGQSAIGEALAQSHTGAIAGSGRALRAFLAECGVIQLSNLEALLEGAALFAQTCRPTRATPNAGDEARSPRPRPRVAAVTTTGGGAAMVIDQLGLRDVEPAWPDDALRTLLAGQIEVRDAPIIDLTLTATADKYAAVLQALARWPGCDAVLAVVGSSARSKPELAVEPIVAAAARWDTLGGKPLAAFLAPQAEDSLQLLANAGIAAFRTPEACADALAATLATRRQHAPVGSETAPTTDAAVVQRVATALRTLRDQAGDAPDEAHCYPLLNLLGVPVAPWRFKPDDAYARAEQTLPDALLEQVTDLPTPWVLKACSPDLPHKTEAGAVALGIDGAEDLRERGRRMRQSISGYAAAAKVRGWLIQQQLASEGEVLLGYRRDPVVGPIVVLAAGGIEAELLDDVAVAPAPVSRQRAAEMVGELRLLKKLSGFRGRPAGDLDALVDAVCAFSSLGLDPDGIVAEAEINPLLVRRQGQGVVAVDALLRFAEPPCPQHHRS